MTGYCIHDVVAVSCRFASCRAEGRAVAKNQRAMTCPHGWSRTECAWCSGASRPPARSSSVSDRARLEARLEQAEINLLASRSRRAKLARP